MNVARNPILPGCHPDPSVCRVDGAFYVVTSTFEYFPGLPVHRSLDLVHWELVGHAIHREAQLDLSSVPSSGGLFAPTIRHHDGRFLVACTLVGGDAPQGSFVVTAEDPAGPWSDPAWIDGADGIDPSILVDDDGRAWWCGTRLARPGAWHEQTEVWVRELDLDAMRLVGDEHVVWNGALTGAVWAEGPHLFRTDDGVLLLASEGGTERHHAVAVARSDAPTGPFRGYSGNPVLTHRHLGSTAGVANVGHADLVDDGRGGWWATVLATRRIEERDALQGRETWLVPVAWEDGWPVFAPGTGRVPDEVEVPWAEGPARAVGARIVDDFDGPDLDRGLALVRSAAGVPRATLGERPGWLRLRPTSRHLGDPVPHAFLGRPLAQPCATVEAVLDLPAAGTAGGLALRLSDARHVTVAVRTTTADESSGAAARVDLARHVDGADQILASTTIGPGPVTLHLELDGFAGHARLRQAGRDVDLGPVDLTPLSPSEGGGFVGVWAGVFAVGEPGDTSAFVDVDRLVLEYPAV